LKPAQWNPHEYLHFRAERSAPFDDLIRLIDFDALKIGDRKRIVDLGCGTGELTRRLAELAPGCEVVGIDCSPEMLAQAKTIRDRESGDVIFTLCRIEDLEGEWDLIFSNAAIHWVEDHPKLLSMLWKKLNSGGQIAIQVPSGVRNKAQLAVMETAESPEFLTALGGWRWRFPVPPVDQYTTILFNLGAREIVAIEKVYPHLLADGEAVYNWVAGTTMTAYTSRLPDSEIEMFKRAVQERILKLYPDSPAFFPFRRIFFAAVKR